MSTSDDLRDLRDALDSIAHGALPRWGKPTTKIGQEAQTAAHEVYKKFIRALQDESAAQFGVANARVEVDDHRTLNEALTDRAEKLEAEVERLWAQTDREVELRRAASAETERQFLRAERAERGGRTVVDADWLRENWSTVEDDEEILITAGGVRLWMAEREAKRRSDQPQLEMDL